MVGVIDGTRSGPKAGLDGWPCMNRLPNPTTLALEASTSTMSSLLLNIRRGSTPFYRGVQRYARAVLRVRVPVPRLIRPLVRAIYHTRSSGLSAFRYARAILYVTPLFSSRCETAGRGVFVFAMPVVNGHTRIHLGDNVLINGKIGIASGRVFDEPTLRIGNGVVIGHEVRFSVNREVCVEDGVFIADRVTIADNDGHPKDPDLRARFEPPPMADVKPVRICRQAWIGHGAQIRKGVTIGEAAIVGVNSVVLTDVPPYCIVLGVPATVTHRVRNDPAAPPTANPACRNTDQTE